MVNIEDLDVAGQPEHIAPEEYVAPTGGGTRKPVPVGRYTVKMTDGKLKGDGNERHPVVYRLIGQQPNQALETQFAVKVVGGPADGQNIYTRLTSFKRDRKVKVNGTQQSYKTNDILDVIRAIGDKTDITQYSQYVHALQSGVKDEAPFSAWIDMDVWCKQCGYQARGAKNFPLDENGEPATSFPCPGVHLDGEGERPTLNARNTLNFASPVTR